MSISIFANVVKVECSAVKFLVVDSSQLLKPMGIKGDKRVTAIQSVTATDEDGNAFVISLRLKDGDLRLTFGEAVSLPSVEAVEGSAK
ncbi:hypothetical protein [Cupriavidus plantarum]|uniref:hypothetical protein n=1 Tax=Cupriavidus plantarum TaxID=942865 RepID=UPI000E26B5F8|nr:hypothetical protein [Cupriavidus plantarum]REE92619.1 hypothetical protein C7418_3888 [Cupriavidus plantarum]